MKILPATSTERRRLLFALGGLMAAAGLAYWIQRPTVEAEAVAVTAAERIQATGALPVPEGVKFGTLEDVPVLGEAGRNPFAYGVRPAPPPPPPPTFTPAPAASLPPPAVAAAPTGPPPIPLKLTGMTQAVTGGRFMVTLQDPVSKAVYVGYEGDVVDGRYKIVRVGAQSAVVSYLDGTGLRTLQLGG